MAVTIYLPRRSTCNANYVDFAVFKLKLKKEEKAELLFLFKSLFLDGELSHWFSYKLFLFIALILKSFIYITNARDNVSNIMARAMNKIHKFYDFHAALFLQ